MSEIGPKTIEPFIGRIEKDDDEPLPVCVENDELKVSVKESRSWGTAITALQTIEVQRIVPANPRRHSLVILNTGAPTVNLIESRSGVGFPLSTGQSVTMNHQDAVYAGCPTASAATNATLAMMWENNK